MDLDLAPKFDPSLDLQPMSQQPDLQEKLNLCAMRAIELAFSEFQGTEVAESVFARLAEDSDQSEIQKIFDKYPMSLPGFDLVYDRSPDFFALLRARGEAHAAVTGGKKGSSALLGLGAITIREGFISGSRTRVAYLGDLRVIPNRKTFRLWRTIYSRLIEEVSRELGVEVFLTAILGDNTLALRSLVERRNSDFIYESIGQVRMINVLGPWAPFPESRQLKTTGLVAKYGDETAYQEFARTHSARIRHGYFEPPKSGLPIVVFDRDGRVVLGLRLVSPDAMKRMKMAQVSTSLRLAMRLAGINKDGALSTLYLSGMVFHHEASAVLRRLALIEAIETCYREPILKEVKKRTMLVIPDSIGLSFRDLRGRMSASQRVQIFEVRSKNFTPSLGPSSPINVQDLAFEMSLV